MTKKITLLLFLAAIIAAGCASPLRAQEKNYNDAPYAEMVGKSGAMAADFDFAHVREFYTRTSYFDPYGVNPKNDFREFIGRQKAGDEAVMTEIARYAATHFPLPESHDLAAQMYRNIGDEKSAAYHDWAAAGLIAAMKKAGDGKSAEEAIPVLNASEELMMMGMAGYEVVSQSVVKQDGRTFDVLNGRHKDTGEKSKIWFDVTQIHFEQYQQGQ